MCQKVGDFRMTAPLGLKSGGHVPLCHGGYDTAYNEEDWHKTLVCQITWSKGLYVRLLRMRKTYQKHNSSSNYPPHDVNKPGALLSISERPLYGL